MSVYKSIQRVLSNDVYATPITDRRARTGPSEPSREAPAHSDARMASETAPETDWRYAAMRHAEQPRNVLLPYTARWAGALPVEIRPHVLLRDYPRVANMIALLWGEPTKIPLRGYFDSLMVDNRGGRKGFPPAVALDLMGLREHYDHRYGVR